MMKLSDLSKEQKQAIVLIFMVSVAGVYALIRFALQPAMKTFSESKVELQSYREKVKKAESLIALEDDIRAQLLETTRMLYDYNKRYMPSTVNGLSWATETMYRHSRSSGIEFESVGRVSAGRVPWANSDKDGRVFIPFATKVVAQCGFFELVDLLRQIEEGNPYVSIGSISMSAMAKTPKKHRVTIEIEWPIWKNKAASDWIRGPSESGEKQ